MHDVLTLECHLHRGGLDVLTSRTCAVLKSNPHASCRMNLHNDAVIVAVTCSGVCLMLCVVYRPATDPGARVQAYFGSMNAHTCQRFGFLQAQDRYKERPSTNPLAFMVFRQVLSTLACQQFTVLADVAISEEFGMPSVKSRLLSVLSHHTAHVHRSKLA